MHGFEPAHEEEEGEVETEAAEAGRAEVEAREEESSEVESVGTCDTGSTYNEFEDSSDDEVALWTKAMRRGKASWVRKSYSLMIV